MKRYINKFYTREMNSRLVNYSENISNSLHRAPFVNPHTHLNILDLLVDRLERDFEHLNNLCDNRIYTGSLFLLQSGVITSCNIMLSCLFMPLYLRQAPGHMIL